MERQTITVTIRTEGEACMLSDPEIREWYRSHIAQLFDPAYGTPGISVSVERETTENAPSEKTYRFYGWEGATVRDRNGLTPRDYYDLLSDAWCAETCAPRMRPHWSRENQTLGQCSITSFLMQDTFGGRVFGVPLPDGGYHCFNAVGGCLFDLTSEQFGDTALDYTHCPEQVRDAHFSDPDKRARYELLKQRLAARMQQR